MIIFVRHGATKLNDDDKGERVRGWLPATLTSKGTKQAHDIAETLKGVSPHTLHTSDLPRAHETAKIIGKHIGATPSPSEHLRTWHVGDLAGQKHDDVETHIHRLLDNPDEPAPNGESINSFIQRSVPHLHKMVTSPDTHIMVGHGRHAQVLSQLIHSGGEHVDPRSMKGDIPIEPGQSMIVSPDWTSTHKPK